MVRAIHGKQRRRRKQETTRPHAPEAALPRRLWVLVAVGALLIVHGALAITSVRQKSCTFDEVAHLTKGYAFWHVDDNRLMPDHPPLAQAWAALPLMDGGLRFPSLNQEYWHKSDIYKLGKQFFFRLGNHPERMLVQSRAMIVLLSMVLGGLVFRWSTKLFGRSGGFVALTLYTFSPTVLAHGRLVTTDLVVSLFFLLSVTAIWHVLHRVSLMALLGCTLAVAGLFLSKMSAVLVLPMAAALVVLRVVDGRALHVRFRGERRIGQRWKMAGVFCGAALVCTLGVWFAVWVAFAFRYEAMVKPEPGRDTFFTASPVPEGKDVWEHQGRGIQEVAASVAWSRRHRLLPEAYLYGFLSTMQAARGRDAFLDGERRLTGWWYFFPLCFLYKVPLPVMCMIVLAVAGVFVKNRPSGDSSRGGVPPSASRITERLYRTAPLWVLLVTYWGFAVTANLNIGHRHLLPTFAPMFILCGTAGVWMSTARWWARAVVPGVLAVLAVVSLATWPDYLAHFNWIGGGRSGAYRHLVDSSLDWGQDLAALSHRLAENRDVDNVYVAYFGTAGLRHHGIKASSLPRYLGKSGTGDYRLRPGLYCISATRLQQVYMLKSSRWTDAYEIEYRRLLPEMRAFENTPDTSDARAELLARKDAGFRSRFKRFQRLQFGRLCAYLRQREPDDHVGHSILIYGLSEDDLRRALDEPKSTGISEPMTDRHGYPATDNG